MTPSATDSIKEQLFEAARMLIGKMGYAELSHADLTFEVGIGRTTFYEHFASKEDLLVQMVVRDLPPLVAEIVDSVDSDMAPDARLWELARGLVEFVGTDHIGLILHTEVPHLSSEAQARITEAHTGLSLAFASTYRQGVEEGIFRIVPPRLAGRMMEQMIMTGGEAVMRSTDPIVDAADIARVTADMVVAAFRLDKAFRIDKG